MEPMGSPSGIAGGKMGVSVCCMLVLQFSPLIHSISTVYCTSPQPQTL